jgi:hypothetical protein
MKKKQPASLEVLMAGQQSGAGQGDEAVPMPLPAKTYDKATVYLPRSALKRLKQMALDHECRVNDFLQEGVDMMLAKYGQPSLKEFREK